MIYAVLAGIFAGGWWLLWGRKKISPEVKLLGEHMVNCSEEWQQLTHSLKHKESNVQIWTCNGFDSCHLYPGGKGVWNLKEKRYIWECRATAVNRRVLYLIGRPKKVKV